MNKVILVGNLGADAELKALNGDNAVLKFNLATSEKWTDKDGEKQERTEWHRCNLFGARAKSLAQYLTKGTKLVVEGSIRYGSYEKEGVKHYTTDINVNNVEFAGGGKSGSSQSSSEDSSPPSVGDEEIPF